MISREEAIESLERVRELSGLKGCRENIAINMAIEALSHERPKGRWVGIQSEKFIGYDEWGEPMYRLCSYYTCRKCGRKTVVKTNFCPKCGAEMVRGEEE